MASSTEASRPYARIGRTQVWTTRKVVVGSFATVALMAIGGWKVVSIHEGLLSESGVFEESTVPTADVDSGPGSVMPGRSRDDVATPTPTLGRARFCDDDDLASTPSDLDNCVPVTYCEDDDPQVQPKDCVPSETPAACEWCSRQCDTTGENHPHIKELTCEYCESACMIFTPAPTGQPSSSSQTRQPSPSPTRGPTQPTQLPTPAPTLLATPAQPAPMPTLPFFELAVNMRLDGVEVEAFSSSDYEYSFKQTTADVLGLKLDAIQNLGAFSTRRRRLREALSDCDVSFDVLIKDATNITTIYEYESNVHSALRRSGESGIFLEELLQYANSTGSAYAVEQAKKTTIVTVLVVLITSEPPTTAYRPTYAPTTTAVYEAAKVRDESWQQRTRTFFLATVLWIPVYGWCLVVAVLACVFFTFAWLSAEATVEWLPARKPVTKHPWWVEEDYGGRSGALKWTKTSASRSASQSRLAGSRAEQYSLLHQLG